jgi:hypothetical protein
MPLVRIEYIQAQGSTIDEMRDALRASSAGQAIIKNGDTILVWVNEGDIHLQRMNVDIYNMNLAMDTHNNPEEGV